MFSSSHAAVDDVLALSTQWDPLQKKKVGVAEASGDIMIVPQASLAGKMKNKRAQYVFSSYFV